MITVIIYIKMPRKHLDGNEHKIGRSEKPFGGKIT